LPQVKAPDWHGRNLNALNYSLINGSINRVEPPYVIESLNEHHTSNEMSQFMKSVITIFNEAIEEGREIKLNSNW
jgi:hypothetical protein